MFRKRLIFGVVALAFFLSFYFLLYPPPDQSNQTPLSDDAGQALPKAAILDQLSLYLPNQTFIQSSMAILTEAGFVVDYYGENEVTVELYRRLPSLGYDLIILRVHSGLMVKGDEITRNVGFFTSEPYSTTKHISEQLNDQVSVGIPSLEPFEEDEEAYFVITPKFVRSSMNERFDNTLIIMMGCDGLAYTPMAEALIGRGALVYIGWNDVVTIDYVDNATLHLLNGLIVEKKTIWDAVMDTRGEIGPDPHYSAEVVFYPVSSQSEKIQR